MVLRKDRKGMISFVDALIFVSVLSLVSVSLISYCASECHEEPMAKSVCDDFISIELKASDVLNTQDSDVYSISDLLASATNSNDRIRIENYIRSTLEDLVPKTYGYEMHISFWGNNLDYSRSVNGATVSEYTTDVVLINGNAMTYHLIITQ